MTQELSEDAMTEKILLWSWTTEKNRKEYNDFIEEIFGTKGREIALKLWRNKEFYVGGWKYVRVTPKGFDHMTKLRDQLYTGKGDRTL